MAEQDTARTLWRLVLAATQSQRALARLSRDSLTPQAAEHGWIKSMQIVRVCVAEGGNDHSDDLAFFDKWFSNEGDWAHAAGGGGGGDDDDEGDDESVDGDKKT